ncbi:MAG: hypothetical protein AABY22_04775 [Nanoarchaeota archaeon]
MKVYFAGISGNANRLRFLKDFGANKLMLTYADIKLYGRKQWERFQSFDILFDSGAFSIWKRGIELDINDYCKYLEEKNIQKYICLDKIGDWEKTGENLAIMEGNGFNPIPVFHYGTPLNKLEILINKGYNYICLGGTVGRKRPEREKFFNEVFANFNKINFHGLGMTDIALVKKYPFYSIDSTTWLCCEKVGEIFDENGKRIKVPMGMTQEDKYKNTITFFTKLENL